MNHRRWLIVLGIASVVVVAFPIFYVPAARSRNALNIVASEIIVEGGYPPIPAGSKVTWARICEGWRDKFGLVRVADLQFRASPESIKLWQNSLAADRTVKHPVLAREELINPEYPESGLVYINLILIHDGYLSEASPNPQGGANGRQASHTEPDRTSSEPDRTTSAGYSRRTP